MAEPYELRHWHPVLLAKDLGTRPRAVMLHGQEIALFRTRDGLGALGNTCPHRRARLSDGHVDGDAIVCPYHGFRYCADGSGASPGTPQMRLGAVRYAITEAWNVLWVRRWDGTDPPLPALGLPGYDYFDTLVQDIECPLEPLVDNFCEVEHTPSTHALLGYHPDGLATIETAMRTSDDEVHVVNRGPQKRLPRLLGWAFDIWSGDVFTDEWTVRFSPVHIVYEQSWRDPSTGAPRPESLHLGVFFTPIDRDETRLVTIVFAKRRPSRLDPVLRPLIKSLITLEVRLDQRRVERLADQGADLRGTRLGRFDAPLREHRKRIETIYRGRAPSDL